MAMTDFLFTSESVSEGHPDKVADQISDAILDAIIAQDPVSRVACETLVTTGMAMIAGEITTSAYVDMPEIVRQTIKEIGYDDSSIGFDYETCAVLTTIDRQSPDISQGVTEGQGMFAEQGADVAVADLPPVAAIARERIREADLDDRIEVAVGDFHKLDSEPGSWDAVVCQEAIIHSNDRPKVFTEVFRVLRPGGEFLFIEERTGQPIAQAVADWLAAAGTRPAGE